MTKNFRFLQIRHNTRIPRCPQTGSVNEKVGIPILMRKEVKMGSDTKRKKDQKSIANPHPEKTIQSAMTAVLKSGIRSGKKQTVAIVGLRVLALSLRDIGIPPNWRKKTPTSQSNPMMTFRDKKKAKNPSLPKPVSKLLSALWDMTERDNSAELAFRTIELVFEIDERLEGLLTKHLQKHGLESKLLALANSSTDWLGELLADGDTEPIARMQRFFRRGFPEFEIPFTAKLKSIREKSIQILPQVSRAFLTEKSSSVEETSSVRFADPSESVEVRQMAQLLRGATTRQRQGKIDAELFESLVGFAKSFKNLEQVYAEGDTAVCSHEYFDGPGLVNGQNVTVAVPPIIWRSGNVIRVILKGKVNIR